MALVSALLPPEGLEMEPDDIRHVFLAAAASEDTEIMLGLYFVPSHARAGRETPLPAGTATGIRRPSSETRAPGIWEIIAAVCQEESSESLATEKDMDCLRACDSPVSRRARRASRIRQADARRPR
jgi:hypothetical protein